jgi:hypothetical protein
MSSLFEMDRIEKYIVEQITKADRNACHAIRIKKQIPRHATAA